jgi:hypothetical protein
MPNGSETGEQCQTADRLERLAATLREIPVSERTEGILASLPMPILIGCDVIGKPSAGHQSNSTGGGSSLAAAPIIASMLPAASIRTRTPS